MPPSETSTFDPLTSDFKCGVHDKAVAVVDCYKTPFPYAPACIEERHKETCVIVVLRTESSCTCEVHA